MNESLGEITVFEKSDGPLSKHLALRDGKIVNDSSACFLAHGSAHRVKIYNMKGFADLINDFGQNQAYALGCLKDGVPDSATVVVADELNDEGGLSVIARTKKYLVFKEGEPGFVLLDIDVKGMPDTVKRCIEECGDIWGALCEVLPVLENVACVERASTSSGLRNKETGEIFPGSVRRVGTRLSRVRCFLGALCGARGIVVIEHWNDDMTAARSPVTECAVMQVVREAGVPLNMIAHSNGTIEC
jgi:hypothetical protein